VVVREVFLARESGRRASLLRGVIADGARKLDGPPPARRDERSVAGSGIHLHFAAHAREVAEVIREDHANHKENVQRSRQHPTFNASSATERCLHALDVERWTLDVGRFTLT